MNDMTLANYCIDLHRRNTEQLGLIPKNRVREYAGKGQIFSAYEGGLLCGYLISGLTPPWAKVWQACVEFDLRGLHHGTAMVNDLATEAKLRGCTGITLRCRDGLAGNWFWQALGFEFIHQIPGGRRRGNPLNVWAKQIAPDLFTVNGAGA